MTAWAADTQNDMTVATQIEPRNADVLDIDISFTIEDKVVAFRGVCSRQ